MPVRNAVPDGVVHSFASLFRARRDDFVLLPSPQSFPRRAKRALTEGDLRRHLEGRYSVGPYILSPDIGEGGACFYGCVDIDDDGLAGWEALSDCIDMLRALGVTPVPATSKRRGLHCWGFWDIELPAKLVRRVLDHAARLLARKYDLYKRKEDGSYKTTGKIAPKKIAAVEAFPKQDALGGNTKWGSALQLPLQGDRMLEGRSQLLDPETLEAFDDQWTSLRAVRPDSSSAWLAAAGKVPDPPKPPQSRSKKKKKQPPPGRGATNRWERVKESIDLVAYVREATGQPGKRVGPEVGFMCPFHEETAPSFMVNADKGLFHCHGCEMAGDVFDFYQALSGEKNNVAAMKALASWAGVDIGGTTTKPTERNGKQRRREEGCGGRGRSERSPGNDDKLPRKGGLSNGNETTGNIQPERTAGNGESGQDGDQGGGGRSAVPDSGVSLDELEPGLRATPVRAAAGRDAERADDGDRGGGTSDRVGEAGMGGGGGGRRGAGRDDDDRGAVAVGGTSDGGRCDEDETFNIQSERTARNGESRQDDDQGDGGRPAVPDSGVSLDELESGLRAAPVRAAAGRDAEQADDGNRGEAQHEAVSRTPGRRDGRGGGGAGRLHEERRGAGRDDDARGAGAVGRTSDGVERRRGGRCDEDQAAEEGTTGDDARRAGGRGRGSGGGGRGGDAEGIRRAVWAGGDDAGQQGAAAEERRTQGEAGGRGGNPEGRGGGGVAGQGIGPDHGQRGAAGAEGHEGLSDSGLRGGRSGVSANRDRGAGGGPSERGPSSGTGCDDGAGAEERSEAASGGSVGDGTGDDAHGGEGASKTVKIDNTAARGSPEKGRHGAGAGPVPGGREDSARGAEGCDTGAGPRGNAQSQDTQRPGTRAGKGEGCRAGGDRANDGGHDNSTREQPATHAGKRGDAEGDAEKIAGIAEVRGQVITGDNESSDAAGQSVDADSAAGRTAEGDEQKGDSGGDGGDGHAGGGEGASSAEQRTDSATGGDGGEEVAGIAEVRGQVSTGDSESSGEAGQSIDAGSAAGRTAGGDEQKGDSGGDGGDGHAGGVDADTQQSVAGAREGASSAEQGGESGRGRTNSTGATGGDGGDDLGDSFTKGDTVDGDDHPHAPGPERLETLRLIREEIILAANGPHFSWRKGNRAYSETWHGEIGPADFKHHYTQFHLDLIAARSADITQDEYNEAAPRKRRTIARKLWMIWCLPAYYSVLDELPQQGEVAGVTAGEEAEIADAVKVAVSQNLRFADGVSELPITRSLLRFAIEHPTPSWRQVGNLGAWCRAGPRIAIAYDFLMAYGDSALRRFNRVRLARSLSKFGIARSENFMHRVRAYVINDDWLCETFDVEIEAAPEQPEPALLADAAGDMDEEDEDIPF